MSPCVTLHNPAQLPGFFSRSFERDSQLTAVTSCMLLRPLLASTGACKPAGFRSLMVQRPISAYMIRDPSKRPQTAAAGVKGSEPPSSGNVQLPASANEEAQDAHVVNPVAGVKRRKPDSGLDPDARGAGATAPKQDGVSTPPSSAGTALSGGASAAAVPVEPVVNTEALASTYHDTCKQIISTHTKQKQALPLQQLLLEPGWSQALSAEMSKSYFTTLSTFVHQEYLGSTPIYPPRELVFRAFHACPLNQVRVVILGQDPYPNVGQAMGLCFSVNRGITKPQSLNIIFKELQRDCGCPIPNHGDLSSWSTQGVLMLNTLLTVRAKAAASHKGKGWENFTDAAISAVSRECRGVVFLLWGKHAQAKAKLVDGNKHHVLTAPHPSPLAAASGNVFVGCGHFKRANELLTQQGGICHDNSARLTASPYERPDSWRQLATCPSRRIAHKAYTRATSFSMQPNSATNAQAPHKLKLLALHSFRTSGKIFNQQFTRARMPERLGNHVEVVYLDAPNPASGPIPRDVAPFFEGPYYEWFTVETMGDKLYLDEEKLNRSLNLVARTLRDKGPFDGVVGFSQGAALAATLVALQATARLEQLQGIPPLKCCILFAGFKPRYAPHAYLWHHKLSIPSLHVFGDRDELRPDCKVLSDAFENPVVIQHTRGHSIPALTNVQVAVVSAFLSSVQQAAEPTPAATLTIPIVSRAPTSSTVISTPQQGGLAAGKSSTQEGAAETDAEKLDESHSKLTTSTLQQPHLQHSSGSCHPSQARL